MKIKPKNPERSPKVRRINEFNRHLKPQQPKRAKCLTTGVTHVMFRVSRLCGVGPVRFERGRDGLLASVSPTMSVVAFIVISLLNIVAFVGLIRDYWLPLKKSTRAGTPTKRVVWMSDFLLLMMNLCVAGYRAPVRVEEVIRCLDVIEQIRAGLESDSSKKALEDMKKSALFIIFISAATIMDVIDYVNYVEGVKFYKQDIYVAGLYIGYFIAYVIMLVMQLQFMVTVLEAQRTLRVLNDLLEDLQHVIKQQNLKVHLPNNFINVVPAKSISKAIDFMKNEDDKNLGFNKAKSLKTLPEMIRHLVLSYVELCSVMRRLNVCFGPEILAIIADCLLHLVITPYNLINTMHNDTVMELGLATMQVVWCSWHVLTTLLAVEPCHMTQRELERTNWLINHLMLLTTDDQVLAELENFAKSLTLNRVEYTAMGACTLSRSLVVSILGSVATYLVIIVQFQATEKI